PKGDCFPVWAVVGGRLSLFRQCADLYGKITDSGALRNSALQRESSSLLRQPVQEPVPAAATDDKETFESFSAQGLDFPQAGCVSRRQAMKDEIGDGGRRRDGGSRNAVVAFQLPGDFLRHLLRRNELGVIHIEKKLRARQFFCRVNQVLRGPALSSRLPCFLALAQQP